MPGADDDNMGVRAHTRKSYSLCFWSDHLFFRIVNLICSEGFSPTSIPSAPHEMSLRASARVYFTMEAMT